MEAASISAKIELVRAGFFAWDSEQNDHRRKHLAEALWWLCDQLEHEIAAGGQPGASYSAGYAGCLVVMAGEMFKTGKRPDEFHKVEDYCLKADMHLPPGDDPEPPGV